MVLLQQKHILTEVAIFTEHTWTHKADSVVLAISGTSVRNGLSSVSPILITTFIYLFILLVSKVTMSSL